MWKHTLPSKCLALQRSGAGVAGRHDGTLSGSQLLRWAEEKIASQPRGKAYPRGGRELYGLRCEWNIFSCLSLLPLQSCLLKDRGVGAELGAAEKTNLARKCQDGPQDPGSIYANSCGHPPRPGRAGRGSEGSQGLIREGPGLYLQLLPWSSLQAPVAVSKTAAPSPIPL